MSDKVTLEQMHGISDGIAPDHLRDLYDRWAEQYDQDLTGKHSYATPQRAAAALAEHVSDRSVSVLDIGCGTGLSGLHAQAKGFTRIDGCDLSTGMLEKAQATGIYGHLFQANLYDPPIAADDDAYDVALVVGAFAVGHLSPDVLPEILRVVKSGGSLVLTVNDMTEKDGEFLGKRLRELESNGKLTVASVEHGDHIPERGVGAWVYVCDKA